MLQRTEGRGFLWKKPRTFKGAIRPLPRLTPCLVTDSGAALTPRVDS